MRSVSHSFFKLVFVASAIFGAFATVAFSTQADAGEIHVVRAAWGKTNLTTKAADFCNGKQTCKYKVAQKYAGEVGADVHQGFSISWKCSVGKRAKVQSATSADGVDAEGQVLSLDCPLEPLSPEEQKRLFGNRHSMFRQILADPNQNQVMTAVLGASCANEINAITQSGQTLKSDVLIKALQPLGSITFPSGVQDDTFYHYTKADALITALGLDQGAADPFANAVRARAFDKEFIYLRTRTLPREAGVLWNDVLYVAEDPTSSADFGNREIEFKLNLKARTLMYDTSVWTKALDEISSRFPKMAAACHMALDVDEWATYHTVYYNNVILLIAEDSGVEVIDYGQDHHWFQVVSPTAFTGLRLVK